MASQPQTLGKDLHRVAWSRGLSPGAGIGSASEASDSVIGGDLDDDAKMRKRRRSAGNLIADFYNSPPHVHTDHGKRRPTRPDAHAAADYDAYYGSDNGAYAHAAADHSTSRTDPRSSRLCRQRISTIEQRRQRCRSDTANRPRRPSSSPYIGAQRRPLAQHTGVSVLPLLAEASLCTDQGPADPAGRGRRAV